LKVRDICFWMHGTSTGMVVFSSFGDNQDLASAPLAPNRGKRTERR